MDFDREKANTAGWIQHLEIRERGGGADGLHGRKLQQGEPHQGCAGEDIGLLMGWFGASKTLSL